MPLAFTDVGLAYICIAATAIDPRERGEWLKKIAAQLEARAGYAQLDRVDEARRHYELERKRLERLREQNEQVQRKIWLKRRTVEWLIGKFVMDGWLTEEEAEDDRHVDECIAALLDQMADAEG